MTDQDFRETLRGILASAAAHGDDEAAGKMVRNVFGTDDALTLLTARCRVLEASAEGLGNAAMAVANDCQGYLDDEEGPGPREMVHAFLGTLTPAIEAACPGAKPPYTWDGEPATTQVVTIYVAWGDTGSGSDGRLSFAVRDPDGVLPAGRGPGSSGSLHGRLDTLFLDDLEWEAFEEGLRKSVGGALEAEGDNETDHGWRLPPGTDRDVERAADVVNALIDRLRGLGLEVAE